MQRLPKPTRKGPRLRKQLEAAGHDLQQQSQTRLHCTRCRQSAHCSRRAEWVAAGDCKPLVANRPQGSAGVFWGVQTLHHTHLLRWDGAKGRWHCLNCKAVTAKTARLLAKPCRKREATGPLPALTLAPPRGGSARWESFKQRILGRIRQGPQHARGAV